MSVLQRGGSVRSYHVEKVTAKNLRPIVDEMVAGRRAFNDRYLYRAARAQGQSASISQVNHKEKEYVRYESGEKITTNTVEGYFSILKRGNIGIYHHWSKKYMGQYLREFDWRYNARNLSRYGAHRCCLTDDRRKAVSC